MKGHNEGSIRQRKDGRWEVRISAGTDFQTGKSKRISRYAKTKSEAVKILHELEYQIHHMKQIDPTSTTLVDWLSYWLETYKKNNLKQSTYVSYRGYIEKHVAIAFPTIKLKDLTARDLQEFYNCKIANGFSPKTILNIHRCLHEALKQAVLELAWKNIDLKSETLFVRQTLNRLEKIDYNGTGTKTEIVIQTPKTKNSIRSIPLLPFIVKELHEWRNIQLSDKAIAEAVYQDSGLVVTNQFGGYIEPRTFKDYYNQILSASGIGHYTFHALCHTFCTRALENGMDAKTVSAIMGHYSVAFTLDTYGYVLDSYKREEMMKMENIFSVPIQQPSYPVIVTPTMNGFILNVTDFEDLSLEADNIQNGISCIQNELSCRLIGSIPPMPTPFQDLILNAGEFVVMMTI